ncbi:MAG TPA: hypothetical protein VJ696_08630 [Rhodanobacteraceae bacterium]|nr:hypothetical protein [Rhodanobacteraceae bacterium]
MKTAAKLLAAMMVAGLSFDASGACRCSCVQGQIEAVCSSASELPPVCAPRACTVRPLRASLIADKTAATNPEKGQCRETLVLNPQTGAYITKHVCQ